MNTRSDRFQKPGNALKRAEELITVGQHQQACTVLHEVLVTRRAQAKERKHQATFEQIMLKYVELCVQLKDTKRSKDALHQYKSLCNSIGSTASLSTVIQHFLRLTEQRTEQAQATFEAQKLLLRDSPAAESKASHLLLEVSGEGLAGRLERHLVTPWHKFLWDSYRCVLEILRNISKLESLYHETARNALAFCVRYRRKTEFRRMADTLRFHLKTLETALRSFTLRAELQEVDEETLAREEQELIDLSSPETQNAQLETRFLLLHASCDLGLWNEGFKAIEDIKRVLNIRVALDSNDSLADHRAPFFRRFFEKLAEFFWAAQNYTFHAFFLLKYFDLLKPEQRTPEICSALLLSALSISLQGADESEAAVFDFDDQQSKNAKLAVSLGVPVPPSREALLAQLTSLSGVYDLPNRVLPELRDLFDLVERRFQPLELCQAAKPKLDLIAGHDQLRQYAEPLSRLVLVRLFQQLGQVYSKMQFANLRKLAYFYDFYTLETTAVDAVRQRLIDVRFDHQAGVLLFNSRALASDDLRHELTKLAHQLQVAQQMIHPEHAQAAVAQRRAVFQRIVATIDDEHRRALERSSLIERRKEKTEAVARAQSEEEARLAAEEAQRVAKKRAEVEARAREQLAKRQEENKRKLKTAPTSATPGLADEAVEVEAKPSVSKMIADLQAARDRIQTQYKQIGIDLDHFERAKREEERALIRATLSAQNEKDRQHHEKQLEAHQEAAKTEHAKSVAEKKRLCIDMEKGRAQFQAALVARQQKQLERQLEEYAQRKAMLEARLAAAQERRAAEEAERKRKEAEEAERKRREDEEREQRRLEREQRRPPVPVMSLRDRAPVPVAKWTPPSRTDGGPSWRDREAARDSPSRAEGGGSSWREREAARDSPSRPEGNTGTGSSWREREAAREQRGPDRDAPPPREREREPVPRWEPPSRGAGEREPARGGERWESSRGGDRRPGNDSGRYRPPASRESRGDSWTPPSRR